MNLGSATWPELDGARRLLVVPLGSCEQHGPHLPLDTDTRIAAHLAEQLARRIDDTVVAPAVAYGASGEHQGFPGTLSLGAEAMEALIVELVRSADHFAGTVLVNGHGGNHTAVTAAASRLDAEGRRVLAWWPAVPGGDAHAGLTETSLMLALAPELVHLDRAAPGATAPLPSLLGELRSGGVRAVSANGVLGDPAGASRARGEELLGALTEDLVRAVTTWRR